MYTVGRIQRLYTTQLADAAVTSQLTSSLCASHQLPQWPRHGKLRQLGREEKRAAATGETITRPFFSHGCQLAQGLGLQQSGLDHLTPPPPPPPRQKYVPETPLEAQMIKVLQDMCVLTPVLIIAPPARAAPASDSVIATRGRARPASVGDVHPRTARGPCAGSALGEADQQHRPR